MTTLRDKHGQPYTSIETLEALPPTLELMTLERLSGHYDLRWHVVDRFEPQEFSTALCGKRSMLERGASVADRIATFERDGIRSHLCSKCLTAQRKRVAA